MTLARDPFSPTGPDPYERATGDKALVNSLLFSTLVRYKPEPGLDPAFWSLAPDLLNYWEISADPSTWTLGLRQDVHFHDGRLMTAADVHVSIKRMVESPLFQFRPLRDNLENLDSIDDFTVRVRFRQPYVSFIEVLATPWAPILPQDLAGTLIEGPEQLIGTGPFKLLEYLPDDRLILERHFDYFRGGLPYVDGIEIFIIPDETTRLAALRVGQVDFRDLLPGTGLSPTDVSQIEGDPNFVVDWVPGRVLALWFDTQNGPFSDPLLRQAVSVALDRQGLIERLYEGVGAEEGPIPAAFWPQWAIPPGALAPWWDYDPVLAMELMAGAGYPNGLDVPLYTVPQYREASAVVADYLAQVGIFVKSIEDSTAFVQLRQTEGYHGMALFTLASSPTDIDTLLRSRYGMDGVNYSRLADPRVEELIQIQIGEFDPTSRMRFVEEIQAILSYEVYTVPLPVGLLAQAHSSRVQVYTPPRGYHLGAVLERAWISEPLAAAPTPTPVPVVVIATPTHTPTPIPTPTPTATPILPQVFFDGARFVSGEISGTQITVPVGSQVQVVISLSATGPTTGNLEIEVKKDITFAPDEIAKGCFQQVQLTSGINEVGGCFFQALELTSVDFRHYFIRVLWDSELIYDSFNTDTREFVLTSGVAVPAPTPTAVPVFQDDHGDSLASATPIGLGSTPGTIDSAADVDFFHFTAQAGITYTVEVALDTHPDTFLALYDSSGGLLDENDDAPGLGLGSRIVWTAPAAGDNFLAVRSFDQGIDTGSYILSLTNTAPAPTPTPTPVPPTPTPTPTLTGGKIAFHSDRDGDREIYLMDPDGSNQVRLTSSTGPDTTPSISPDGTKIAFERSQEIYVMDINGTNVTRLTNNSVDESSPSWCSNNQIAFASIRDGQWEIYIMDSDGSNQTRLTFTGAHETTVACSLNGTKIAFDSARDGNAELYVMNSDGTNQTRLTFDAGSDGSASWSPDGSKIAWRSQISGNNDIYVMNADGSGQVNVTNHPATDGAPSWSPDGTKVAFDSNRDGDFGIYVMNADGSNVVNITNTPGVDGGASWGP